MNSPLTVPYNSVSSIILPHFKFRIEIGTSDFRDRRRASVAGRMIAADLCSRKNSSLIQEESFPYDDEPRISSCHWPGHIKLLFLSLVHQIPSSLSSSANHQTSPRRIYTFSQIRWNCHSRRVYPPLNQCSCQKHDKSAVGNRASRK